MLVEAAGEVPAISRIQLPGLEFGDEQLGEWFATGAVVAGRFEVDGLQVLVGKVVAGLGSIPQCLERSGDRGDSGGGFLPGDRAEGDVVVLEVGPGGGEELFVVADRGDSIAVRGPESIEQLVKELDVFHAVSS